MGTIMAILAIAFLFQWIEDLLSPKKKISSTEMQERAVFGGLRRDL